MARNSRAWVAALSVASVVAAALVAVTSGAAQAAPTTTVQGSATQIQTAPASTRASSAKGRLKISIRHLPKSLAAKAKVTGANRTSRTVNRSKTLQLATGKYKVRASSIRSGSWIYRPSRTSVTRTVKRGKTSTVTLSYSRRAVPILTPPKIDRSSGAMSLSAYSIGTLSNVRNIWVSPSGSDSNSGTEAAPLRTVTAAWGRIASGSNLTQPHRIQIKQGTYSDSQLPNYWENRWGTSTAPIIFNSVDGAGRAKFTGDINLYNSRYVYFLGLDISRNGDAFHCERCSHVLLRDMTLDGDSTPGGAKAHETIKVNQSDHMYIENSEIRGADDNAIDFVAVQYGHVLNSKISEADDWCAYAKGGSAYVTFANNEVFDCGTGGITVGQGTGFEFMTAPWIYYEGTGVYVVNNVIHDTEGAALGVNGGYNVLVAHNTLYKVGTRSHGIEFVHGMRGCDGDTSACSLRQSAGGWGTTGAEGQYIPNKHVFFYNNVLLNPNGVQSPWNHFQIAGTTTPPSGSNVPSPSSADQDLRIVGTVITHGGTSLALIDGGGCQNSNPTCTDAKIRANNVINDWTPTFTNAAGGNFTPTGQLASTDAHAIPDFSWSDVPGDIWAGGVHNSVPTTKSGAPRSGWGRPGAN